MLWVMTLKLRSLPRYSIGFFVVSHMAEMPTVALSAEVIQATKNERTRSERRLRREKVPAVGH